MDYKWRYSEKKWREKRKRIPIPILILNKDNFS